MRITVKAKNRGLHFEAEPSDRILYAGLTSQLGLPYECATGTCGTCKARLIQGELQDRWPDAPGRSYLKPEQNEFLMCQCSAATDLTIEVPAFVSPTEPGACVPAHTTGTIRDVDRLTDDVLEFAIELSDATTFDAGQFYAIQVPGVVGYRGYSMVNYEENAKRLQFVVKRKPGGGVSEWLFDQVREGVDVELFGPLGAATFYPSMGTDIVCIAGGTGLAGMMAIIERACSAGHFAKHRGHVYFGVRKAVDLFYLDRLRELVNRAPAKLVVTIALSDEEVPSSLREEYPELRFETGFVHSVAEPALEEAAQDATAFVAGPPPAVEAAIRSLVLKARLKADRIRYDKFS